MQAWQIRDGAGRLLNRPCHISISCGFVSAAATNDSIQLHGLGPGADLTRFKAIYLLCYWCITEIAWDFLELVVANSIWLSVG